MNTSARVTVISAISVLVTGLSSGPTQAATFTEVSDAGEQLSTAQIIPGGSQPLTSISGRISQTTPSADLFRIFLTGNQAFSAKTVDRADFDTQLFLFNSAGVGVYGNDNERSTLGLNQSTLPKGDFSPERPGTYYLAVSGFDYDPVSAGGEIFPDPAFPFNDIFGPTGSGGRSQLSGFDGTRLNGGSYTIALTGAKTVPEPSSMLGTLALGVLGVGFWVKKHKRSSRI